MTLSNGDERLTFNFGIDPGCFSPEALRQEINLFFSFLSLCILLSTAYSGDQYESRTLLCNRHVLSYHTALRRDRDIYSAAHARINFDPSLLGSRRSRMPERHGDPPTKKRKPGRYPTYRSWARSSSEY